MDICFLLYILCNTTTSSKRLLARVVWPVNIFLAHKAGFSPSFVTVLAAGIRLFRAREAISFPNEERNYSDHREYSEDTAWIALGN